jgi:phage gp29-like protein
MRVPKPKLGAEIATTRDGFDITRGFSGPVLQPTDSVLRSRGGGDYRIYEAILSDWQVKTCLQQRQLAVVSREWVVEAGGPGARDQAAAEFMREQLNGIGWDRVTNLMLYGVFYGYAVAELIYARDGAHVVIERVAVRNRRRFRFDAEGLLRLLTPDRMVEGIPAPAPYFWHYGTGADHDDEPYGIGLAHWLYWPVLFKRNGIKFWLMFLEKFGSPTAIGRYDAGASEEDRRRLLEATEAIQHDAGIVIPKDMMIDLLEASRAGTASYQGFHDAMDEAIAKVILGQTMTTQDGSSLSQAKVHLQVRSDLVKADADLICEAWNTGPARWLTEWNFPGAVPPRVWRVMEEPEDLGARAERDARVRDLGFRPTLAYIRQTYGDGWEPAPAGVPAWTGTAEFAQASGEADYVTTLADQMVARAGGHIEDWVARIRAEVAQAGGYDELLGRLAVLLAELPLDTLADTLAEGFATAALAGEADARDESRA